jgi:hypothetical protein
MKKRSSPPVFKEYTQGQKDQAKALSSRERNEASEAGPSCRKRRMFEDAGRGLLDPAEEI